MHPENKIGDQADSITPATQPQDLGAIAQGILDKAGIDLPKPVQWNRWYQQADGGKWSAEPARSADAEIARTKPALVSACITNHNPLDNNGDGTQRRDSYYIADWVWFDIDRDDRPSAIAAAYRFADKLEAAGLDLHCARFYASGKKGFHVFVPVDAFVEGWQKSLSADELRWFPDICKEVAQHLFVDGLDMRVYSAGRGRQLRCANVLRECGTYKVALTVEEFRNITPELYDEYVQAPRPDVEPLACDMVEGLASVWDAAAATVIDAKAAIGDGRPMAPVTPEKVERIQSMLDVIAPDDPMEDDSAHALRLKVIQAVRLELGAAEGLKLVKEWVQRSKSRNFTRNEWRQMFNASGKGGGGLVGVGTLITLARERGWMDSHPEQNPKHAPILNGEINEDATPERLTEKGMAEYLASKYRGQLRYLEDMALWITWNGKEWEFDADGSCVHVLLSKEARRLLANAYRDQAQGIAELPADADKEMRKAAEGKMAGQIKFYRGLDGAATIRNIKALVQHEPGLRIGSMRLDQHHELLNVNNGVLNLTTGELRPHAPDLLLTQRAFVDYDAGATCPRWRQFMDEITEGDKALADYLQCVIGYALSGDISRHEAFFLHGDGSNGKSVLVNTLRALLGGYCKSISVDALMVKRDAGGPTPDLLAVRGARMAITSEMSAGRQLNEGVFKDLVSGDTIPVRGMYAKQIIQMRFHCKVFMPTNVLPTIAGQDYGVWRRIRAIPFNRTFEGAEKDPSLEAKLKAELPGILAWAVDGFQRYKAQGFDAPASVTQKTDEYREDLDIVRHFVEEALVQDDVGRSDEGRIPAAMLSLVYDNYCRTMNHPIMGGVRFGREVKKHLTRRARTMSGWQYLGWRVWSEWLPAKLREEIDKNQLPELMHPGFN